jgi:hypothetical protein
MPGICIETSWDDNLNVTSTEIIMASVQTLTYFINRKQHEGTQKRKFNLFVDEGPYDEFFGYPVSRLHSSVHLPRFCIISVSENSYIRYQKIYKQLCSEPVLQFLK